MLNAASPPIAPTGDINQDGNIDVSDIIIVINIIIGDNSYNELADMNDDGIINVVDVVSIVNIILE